MKFSRATVSTISVIALTGASRVFSFGFSKTGEFHYKDINYAFRDKLYREST